MRFDRWVKPPQAAPRNWVESDALPLPDGATLRFHRVERGETLREIAEQLYGDGSFWVLLYGANERLLREAGGLRPGQTLFVPFL